MLVWNSTTHISKSLKLVLPAKRKVSLVGQISIKINSEKFGLFRFVKSKRQSIDPNFNFLGQLLEYDKILRESGVLPQKVA